jgi:hypothetical protein
MEEASKLMNKCNFPELPEPTILGYADHTPGNNIHTLHDP